MSDGRARAAAAATRRRHNAMQMSSAGAHACCPPECFPSVSNWVRCFHVGFKAPGLGSDCARVEGALRAKRLCPHGSVKGETFPIHASLFLSPLCLFKIGCLFFP